MRAERRERDASQRPTAAPPGTGDVNTTASSVSGAAISSAVSIMPGAAGVSGMPCVSGSPTALSRPSRSRPYQQWHPRIHPTRRTPRTPLTKCRVAALSASRRWGLASIRDHQALGRSPLQVTAMPASRARWRQPERLKRTSIRQVTVDAFGIKVSYGSGGSIWNALFTLFVLFAVLGAIAFIASAAAKRAPSVAKTIAKGFLWVATGIAGVLFLGFLAMYFRLGAIDKSLEESTKQPVTIQVSAPGASPEIAFLTAQLAGARGDLARAELELRTRRDDATPPAYAGWAGAIIGVLIGILGALAVQRSYGSTPTREDGPGLKEALLDKPRPRPSPRALSQSYLQRRATLWLGDAEEATKKLFEALKAEKTPAAAGAPSDRDKDTPQAWLRSIKNAAEELRDTLDDILGYAARHAD